MCTGNDPQDVSRSPETLGALRLPTDSERVTDEDEEVFLIYSNLLSTSSSAGETTGFRGLGHVDSQKDLLDINFEITLPALSLRETGKSASRRARGGHKGRTKVISIMLAQDKTALRTRKGDTGSVLWKASIDFAQLILHQIHTSPTSSLFDPQKLKQQRILELGSGTGLLSILLSPYVAHYTATDVPDLIPLIRKSLALNFHSWGSRRTDGVDSTLPLPGSNITVHPFDWITLSTTPSHLRHKLTSFLDPPDLILVIDCIYHPSLLPPLVTAIHHLAIPDHTLVFILVELRAEDVIREFLRLWLATPGWRIWRMGGGVFDAPYIAWVGQRSALEI
ncbi:hypothetical protein AMATHDRAFT_3417 [Amanita thiersii Skay4041]|uniref:Uncharacterized protein n=1 Tax=Amanita thiersii Skay4041 TaxID=703135 RepID=A0A2A9NTC8_9AGAR|nr:hypothetical protein AMATHDRAFT_3417 [Amanita thiersii Skay4041]